MTHFTLDPVQEERIATATSGLQSILDEVLTAPEPTVDQLKAELIAKDAIIEDLQRQVDELTARADDAECWANALETTARTRAYRESRFGMT